MPQAQRADVDDGLTPAELLAMIEGLYHQLEALPHTHQPGSNGQYRGSPAYLALEGQIRELAQTFWALTDGGPTR